MDDPDGNGFIRSISKEILQSERYYLKVRKWLCDFILDHRNTFMDKKESGAAGLLRQVQIMRNARVWAA